MKKKTHSCTCTFAIVTFLSAHQSFSVSYVGGDDGMTMMMTMTIIIILLIMFNNNNNNNHDHPHHLIGPLQLVVQKPPYWNANCPLGHLKQRKFKLTCFLLDVPVCNLHSSISFCQNWLARPVRVQRKCNNSKEHLHDSPSHSSGRV